MNIYLVFRQRQVGLVDMVTKFIKKTVLKSGVNFLIKTFQIKEKKKYYLILKSKRDTKHLEIIYITKLNGLMY